MNENTIWEFLSGLSVGTVVAWIAVIIAIIGAICTATIKLYKVFTRYKELKDDSENRRQKLIEHEKILNDINQSVNEIREHMNEQQDVDVKVIRHMIIGTCETVLEAGHISESKLRSLEEITARLSPCTAMCM